MNISLTRKITSLILKTIVVLSAIVGVTIQILLDSRDLLFFTIQSNIWIGATCIIAIALMLSKTPIKSCMYSIKLIFTVSITLTGVVYCTILAPFMGSKAYTLASTLLHVVGPIAAIADFFVYDCYHAYKKWECLTVTLPPLYYLAFAGIGYALNWDFGYGGHNYPYFFLNWGSPAGAFGFSDELPYIGVFYYVVILLVVVIGIGALYVFIANRTTRNMKKHHPKG